MKRSLKALGLALVAALAFSAMAASGAQAESPGKFTRTDGKELATVITGHQEGLVNEFKVTEGEQSTTCEVATYEGTLTPPAASVTVTPHYDNCDAGGLTANIHLNGCHYDFHAGTYIAKSDTSHGSVDVVCPPEEHIQITAGPCITEVPAQEGLEPVTFTNEDPVKKETPNDWVTVDVAVEGIEYTHTDANFFCPNTDGFVGNDGEFLSKVKVKGYEHEGDVTVTTVGGGTEVEKTAYEHGAEIGIHVR